jgi:hypothetical protein
VVCRLVPPTPVTFGSFAGLDTPNTKFVPLVGLFTNAADSHSSAPLSPELSTNVIPCALLLEQSVEGLQEAGEVVPTIVGRREIELTFTK